MTGPSLAPDVVEDWFNRGAALVDLGRYAEAVASFDRAIAGKPDFIDAHLRRAKALSDLDREHEALAEHRRHARARTEFAGSVARPR